MITKSKMNAATKRAWNGWENFTKATTYSVIAVVLLLGFMALTLL